MRNREKNGENINLLRESVTMNKRPNPEIRDLGTHQAGAVTLHETRKTKKPVQIDPGHAPGAVPEEQK